MEVKSWAERQREKIRTKQWDVTRDSSVLGWIFNQCGSHRVGLTRNLQESGGRTKMKRKCSRGLPVSINRQFSVKFPQSCLQSTFGSIPCAHPSGPCLSCLQPWCVTKAIPKSFQSNSSTDIHYTMGKPEPLSSWLKIILSGAAHRFVSQRRLKGESRGKASSPWGNGHSSKGFVTSSTLGCPCTEHSPPKPAQPQGCPSAAPIPDMHLHHLHWTQARRCSWVLSFSTPNN